MGCEWVGPFSQGAGGCLIHCCAALSPSFLTPPPFSPPLAQARLDDRSAAQLMVVLRDHAVGISKLQAVLVQDALDLKVMQAEGASGF